MSMLGEDGELHLHFDFAIHCNSNMSDLCLIPLGYPLHTQYTTTHNMPSLFLSSKNDHELCAFWTSVGECESNRGFMLENCAAACRLCLLANTNMMA